MTALYSFVGLLILKNQMNKFAANRFRLRQNLFRVSNTKEPTSRPSKVRITNPDVKYKVFGKVQKVFNQPTVN